MVTCGPIYWEHMFTFCSQYAKIHSDELKKGQDLANKGYDFNLCSDGRRQYDITAK